MSAEASATAEGRGRKRPAQTSVATSALECPVCLDAFDSGAQRPLSLVCGHSLCSACTGGLGPRGPCPVCLDAFDSGAQRPLSLVCGHSLCSACTGGLGPRGPCPVCLDAFDSGAQRPLSLVCGHSLCSACTGGLGPRGPCPVCLDAFDSGAQRPLSLVCGHSLCSACTGGLGPRGPCPVCLDAFDSGAQRPLSLVCGHSLCSACTGGLGPRGPCPVCRRPASTLNRPTNFALLQLLDVRAPLYACQACEREVEAEDAWVCEAEDCAETAAPPRNVLLACSRCYIAHHLGHPRLALPRALQLSKQSHDATFSALAVSLADANQAADEAKLDCTLLKKAVAMLEGQNILETPIEMACGQLRALVRGLSESAREAQNLLYKFRAGDLAHVPLMAASSEPIDVRKSLEKGKEAFEALVSRVGQLMVAVAGLTEATRRVGQEAADAGVQPIGEGDEEEEDDAQDAQDSSANDSADSSGVSSAQDAEDSE